MGVPYLGRPPYVHIRIGMHFRESTSRHSSDRSQLPPKAPFREAGQGDLLSSSNDSAAIKHCSYSGNLRLGHTRT